MIENFTPSKLRFRPITLLSLGKCYHFFKKELDGRSRFFFKPHPNFRLVAFFIYFCMWLRHTVRRASYILCYEDGNFHLPPIGFMLLIPEKNNSAVLGLAISQHKRRLGYGKLLMDEMIRMAKEKDLRVLKLSHEPSNEIARKLYLKFGFEDDGTVVSKSFFRKNRMEQAMKLNLL